MPTNDDIPDAAGDPRLAAVATRLRSLRVDLDRLDDQLDLLPRPWRVDLTRYSLHMRADLDSLEDVVTQLGAGL